MYLLSKFSRVAGHNTKVKQFWALISRKRGLKGERNAPLGQSFVKAHKPDDRRHLIHYLILILLCVSFSRILVTPFAIDKAIKRFTDSHQTSLYSLLLAQKRKRLTVYGSTCVWNVIWSLVMCLWWQKSWDLGNVSEKGEKLLLPKSCLFTSNRGHWILGHSKLLEWAPVRSHSRWSAGKQLLVR